MKANRTNRNAFRPFEPLETRQMFAGGTLDPTFSLDGKTTTSFSGFNAFAQDTAIQVDGKTVVAGYALGGGSLTRFAVARYNLDGSLDATFGPEKNGKVLTPVSGKIDMAKGLAIQPDGKIVVVGSSSSSRGTFASDFAIVRYNTDGTLDRSFDADGIRTIRVKGDSRAEAVTLQRDGKIVVAGSDHNGGFFNANNDFAVVRLNRDGSLDPSFGNGGKALVAMGEHEFARAVAIDNSGTRATNPHFGKIVLAGERTNFDGRNEYAIARLTANGKIDNTFDDDGQIVDKVPGYSRAFVQGLLIQSDGKYVLAGHATDGDTPMTLARYRPSGRLDRSFGAGRNGFVTINFGGADRGDDVIHSVDGGLIVAGTSSGRFALAKVSLSGALDTTFGGGGKVITDFGSDGTAANVRLTRAGGSQLVVAGGDRFKTARYRENGGTLITVTSDDPESTESTGNNATFRVTRSEALPMATRVFFQIGGNAHRPNTFTTLTDPVDYSLTRMGVPPLGSAVVDIPANQTSVTVTLRPSNDTVFEGTEHAIFSVLSNPGYDIGSPGAVTISIADKDHVIFSGQLPGGQGFNRGSTRPSLLERTRELFSDRVIKELT